MVAALNAVGPDGLIVRVNAGRSRLEQPFDARYVATLSADAVPALLEALPALPPAERRTIAGRLLQRWGGPETADWRSWSWSRAQAR